MDDKLDDRSDEALMVTLSNYELFLRIVQRTQQLARMLLDDQQDGRQRATTADLEEWEWNAISVQPELEEHIEEIRRQIASRHAARTATPNPYDGPPRVM